MNLKNKIYIIFLLLLVFIFFVNSSVFAVSQAELNILEFDDVYYQALENLDEYTSGEYWYSLRGSSNVSVLFISKSDYPDLKQYISNTVTNSGRSFTLYFNTEKSEVYGKYFTYDRSTGTFINQNISGHGYFHIDLINGNSVYLGGNINIYTDNTYTTTFFQAPLQENLTLEGTIVEMAQTQIIPTVLMMIAVVIGLLISLIGLRKGFKMLVNGLKT